jgi:hypothetical protein
MSQHQPAGRRGPCRSADRRFGPRILWSASAFFERFSLAERPQNVLNLNDF